MPWYLEALWPASPGWSSQIWADRPVVKGDRIVTGTLGPRVRCVKRIHDDRACWSLDALTETYGTQGRNEDGAPEND